MNINKKVVKVKAVSFERFKGQTIVIARGQSKPSKDEPKIWYTYDIFGYCTSKKIKN